MTQTPSVDELKDRLKQKEEELLSLQSAHDRLLSMHQQILELFQHFPVSYYEIDFKSRKFKDLNPFSYSHTEYSRDELLCIDPLDVLTDKSRQALRETFQKLQKGEKITPLNEFEIRTKSGKIKWLLTHIWPILENNRPAGFRNVAIDITERKKMEQKLKESEERFRDLAELLPETIFETDQDGRLVFVNKNAYTYFKYTLEDFEQGLNVFDMVAPRDRNLAIKNFNRILDGEDIGIKEYQLVSKEGRVFPGMVLTAGRLKNGKVTGLRGFMVDLTDRKKLESQLAQSQKMESQRLECLGYHVTSRTSSLEALELFSENPDRFDLVITDMTMPKLTGG